MDANDRRATLPSSRELRGQTRLRIWFGVLVSLRHSACCSATFTQQQGRIPVIMDELIERLRKESPGRTVCRGTCSTQTVFGGVGSGDFVTRGWKTRHMDLKILRMDEAIAKDEKEPDTAALSSKEFQRYKITTRVSRPGNDVTFLNELAWQCVGAALFSGSADMAADGLADAVASLAFASLRSFSSPDKSLRHHRPRCNRPASACPPPQ